MRDASPSLHRRTYLRDYAPVPVTVTHVDLRVRLDPDATRVRARLTCARRGPGDLVLDGEGLRTLSVTLDGAPVAHELADRTLTIRDAPDAFVLETEVQIAPAANTALSGLYMSNGMYCTQCEAEGFRRITWMLDRPDVMATWDVAIESDLPVLLSNGDEVARGHWRDPWPKPTYLFALVAGDLRATSDRFTTMEGRDVALNVWVRPGDEGRTAYAMDALKRSMRWDEEAYGRAYDLSVFNIVAVDDFNMGAMENKGLNIFNSAAVLAAPDTTTDEAFARIESIVAHEYFHNWTGNRITCRDWFQLCLKEGLTVFRDQQFSAHERSAAVQRIQDVQSLRARQFREDNGPLAHPVRPAEFVEINNFYTATVYEKGAEVIGMLRTLVGPEGYRKGVDLYFERHDGEAATIEDWLACFEEACGIDLSQFKLWYEQAGTPRVTVKEEWVEKKQGMGVHTITLTQSTPPTPGQPEKCPMVIPFAYGLLAEDGSEMRPTEVAVLDGETLTITHDTPYPPFLSALRGFSAPVILQHERPASERAFLLAHDADPFARWEAGRALAKDVLARMATSNAGPDATLLDALAATATDASLDPAFRALVLSLPGEDDMAQTLHDAGSVPDPARIHAAREALLDALAGRLEGDLAALMEANATPGPYDPSAASAGRRSLHGAALMLLTRRDRGAAARRAFAEAGNMTESLTALSALLSIGAGEAEARAFRERWRGDRLVTDSWFSLMVARAIPEAAAATAERLAADPDFDIRNPNRFRAVFSSLAAHPAGFHHESGAGYRLLSEWIVRLDALNPQTAARTVGAFETWRRYDADRQGMIAEALDRILGAPNLSPDVREMAQRIRGG